LTSMRTRDILLTEMDFQLPNEAGPEWCKERDRHSSQPEAGGFYYRRVGRKNGRGKFCRGRFTPLKTCSLFTVDKQIWIPIRQSRRRSMKRDEKKLLPPGRATLIYDASCPICSNTIKWIGENEQKGAFTMMPCQSPMLVWQYPVLTKRECMWAMQLALPDGRILAGERALPEIFSRLRRYRFLSLMLQLPGAGLMSRIAYRWFAERRYRISAMLSHVSKGTQKGEL